MKGKLTERESLIADIEYYKHRHDNLTLLTPEEAYELLNAWIMESHRRYGKVNTKTPLYLKLRKGANEKEPDYILVGGAKCYTGK